MRNVVISTVRRCCLERGRPRGIMVSTPCLGPRHAFIANSRYYEEIAGRHIAAVADTLPPEAVATARERGRARDPWETAAELARELEGQLGTAERR
jgi:hypothetical protein